MSSPLNDRHFSGLRAIYFGCSRGVWGHREAGHCFHGPDGRSLSTRDTERAQPFGMPDGKYAPRLPGYRDREAPQGQAALHHKDGWTLLAFWDRTGDSRGNSNSNFIFDAELAFDEAVAAAREHFGELFERFNFDVAPYEGARRAA